MDAIKYISLLQKKKPGSVGDRRILIIGLNTGGRYICKLG